MEQKRLQIYIFTKFLRNASGFISLWSYSDMVVQRRAVVELFARPRRFAFFDKGLHTFAHILGGKK